MSAYSSIDIPELPYDDDIFVDVATCLSSIRLSVASADSRRGRVFIQAGQARGLATALIEAADLAERDFRAPG
jgi:hypothetical protein